MNLIDVKPDIDALLERQDCREIEDFEHPDKFRCIVMIESPLMDSDMGIFSIEQDGICIRGQRGEYHWPWAVMRFLEAGPASVRLLVYTHPVTLIGRLRAALLGGVVQHVQVDA